MRSEVYSFLVNRHPGISYRYHKVHDDATGMRRMFSWAYLLWINFAYYVLFCRFLGRIPEMEIYEKHKLMIKTSESEGHQKDAGILSVEEFVRKIKDYDVISFDIFDTLIFRPFSSPTDVFYLIGEKFDFLDFKNLRVWAEWDARMKCRQKNGHTEVSLQDIWENLEEDTGLNAEEGMRLECETEEKLCYSNPYMLQVWKRLQKLGKRMIIVSDMYLPRSCIERILQKTGYMGAERIYISNEYGENKAGGDLFHRVIRDFSGARIVHIGDSPHSDQKMAKASGLDILPYQNVNKNVLLYRPMDMSSMIGGAYRGLVSNHLYNGSEKFSIDYEYGYVYGGLFVVGYCHFIHEYYEQHYLDRLLFLARDGDILNRVYQKLYPDDRTVYVYWSRKAATKLMADEDKHDFFRRFIYHKVNQKVTIGEALRSMELEQLLPELSDWQEIWDVWERKSGAGRKQKFIDLRAEDELTDKNAYLLRRFIEAKWERVMTHYEEQQVAAEKYYREILHGCENVARLILAGREAVRSRFPIWWKRYGAWIVRSLVLSRGQIRFIMPSRMRPIHSCRMAGWWPICIPDR